MDKNNEVNLAFNQLRKQAEIKKANLGGTTIIEVDEQVEKVLRKQASGSAMVTRMAPAIWSPVLQLTSMVLPKTIEEKNIWRRWYYQHDPVIGTALDLHTRHPLSSFRLRCEGDDTSEIAQEYELLADEARLFNTFMEIGQEYFVCGEALPVGDWNTERRCWNSHSLLNPDMVDIQMNPFNTREKFISIIKWSKPIRLIVDNGPNDPKTGMLYKSLMDNEADVVQAVRTNQPFRISPHIVSHVARKVSPFDLRGTSIIDRLFKVLLYQEKLIEAQMAGASRYATPIELWKLGNDLEPASQQALDHLEEVIRQTWNSPQKAVLWGHTLSGEMIGGSGSLLPTTQEMEWITTQKCAALMVNQSIINADGPTYASASVAADYMASFYLNYRQELENWAKYYFFSPIAKARGYYKPVKREVAGHYRDKTVRRELMIPDIMWDKANLKDDYQKLQQLISLAENQKVPWRIVYDYMNLDFETVTKQLKEEAQVFAGLGGGEGAGEGVPGGGLEGLGGGGGGSAPPSLGELGGEELPTAPSTGASSPGGLTMPPESVGQPNMEGSGSGV